MYDKAYEFNSFRGIDNTSDPVGPLYDKKKRTTYFTSAVNVDITDSGYIKRSRGSRLLESGNFHSFWTVKDSSIGFLMNAGSLKSVEINNVSKSISLTTLLSGFDQNATMHYVETDSRVFMTNGTWIGYYQDGIVNNLPDPGQEFKTKMPAGHLLEFYNNQLFIANGSIIYFSDSVAWNRTDLRKNIIPFPSRIRMIQAVQTGLFVSDCDRIYYLDGSTASDFTSREKLRTPVFENGFCKVPSENTSSENSSGDNVVMLTSSGIYVGGYGGAFIEGTQGHYVPDNLYGVLGYVRSDNEKSQVIFIGSREIESHGGDIEIKLPIKETVIH